MFSFQEPIPKSEIICRIEKLRILMGEANIPAVLIMQNSDLFYFSGTLQQGNLFIPEKGEPILMVRKNVDRAVAESPLKKVIRLKSPKEIPSILKKNGYHVAEILGMELDVVPVNIFRNYEKIFPGIRIVDLSHQIRLVRAVKSAYEINLMKKAASFSDKLAARVPELIEEGITEIALAGRIESVARSMGHQGIVRMRLWGAELFYGHLMCGSRAAIPSFLASPTGGEGAGTGVSQGPGFGKVEKHQPILVDYTFGYMGYLSDHTRIFSIGDLPDELLHAHGAMLQIQELVKREARPGVSSGHIYEIGVQKAEELGYGDWFMGFGPDKIRFIGHGVGTELDEYPFLAKNQTLALKKGMTIALEPKLIIPGKGVVGIENTHIVTDSGLEPLTRFPDEVVIV